MKTAVGILTRDISYDVGAQDLNVSRCRIPTLPASGFVITGVRAAGRV